MTARLFRVRSEFNVVHISRCVFIKLFILISRSPDSSRRNIFLSLLVASVLGTLSFLLLRKSRDEEELLSEEEGQSLLSTGVT